MTQKVKIAWIEIWNFDESITIKRIKEIVKSENDAILHFKLFNESICQWETPFQGMIIETDEGWMRVSADFISRSIIKLHISEIETDEGF